MTLSRAFTYKTFNPNTNDFDNDYKSYHKEVDKATEKRLSIISNVRYACICMILPFIIAALVFGGVSEAVEHFWWAILACVGCMLAFVACIFGALALEEQEEDIKSQFREISFEAEYDECVAYNLHQEQIALEWRGAHPFEEKIRMAQTRGSSVDVAEMVKEYLKLQKGE